MSQDDVCKNQSCQHPRKYHNTVPCNGKQKNQSNCRCKKFQETNRKTKEWWFNQIKKSLIILGIGVLIFLVSLVITSSEIKEGTTTSLGTNQAVLGFYLDGNREYDLLVSGFNNVKPLNVSIQDSFPNPVDMTPQKEEAQFVHYTFRTDEPDIYNFKADVSSPNIVVTFVIKSKSEIPDFYVQIISFIGSGMIGYGLPTLISAIRNGQRAVI
jgi:hypothetical protein